MQIGPINQHEQTRKIKLDVKQEKIQGLIPVENAFKTKFRNSLGIQ